MRDTLDMLLNNLQVICTFPAILVTSKYAELTAHLQLDLHRLVLSELLHNSLTTYAQQTCPKSGWLFFSRQVATI